jgi:hypothetical protein
MDAYWCYQANGYNDHRVLLLWLEHVFSKRKTNNEKCLLIMDGVALHRMPVVIDYCTSNNIIPEYFSPNATCRLQPLDHCLNALLKRSLHKSWEEWMNKLQHEYTVYGNRKKASNETVAGWGYTAWSNITDYNITRSWRHCLFARRDCLFANEYPHPHWFMQKLSGYLPMCSRIMLAQTCQPWRFLLFKEMGLDPDINRNRNTYGVVGEKLLEEYARKHSNTP